MALSIFTQEGSQVGDQQQRTIIDFAARSLTFEKLEDRHVFDAGLSIAVDLGAVNDGLVSDEFTVTGIPDEIAVAETVSLSDSSHIFIYGEQSQSTTDLYARLTPADGHPGPPVKLILSLPSSSADSVVFDAVGIDNEQFVISWHEQDALRAQIFDSKLDPVSEVIIIDPFSGHVSGPIGNHDEFLDVFHLANEEIVFAYIDPDNGSVILQGMNANLTAPTDLHWSSPPNATAFNLEIDQLADSSLQISWLESGAVDALVWSIETVTLQNGQYVDEDSWIVSGFLDTPELEFQSNGNAVVAGVQLQDDQLVTVIETYDDNQTLINSFVSAPNIHLLEGSDQLVVGTDDNFSALFVGQIDGMDRAFLSTFNSSGDLIGVNQPLNQSDLFSTPKGTMVSLENGGYAVYWVGYGLDQTSPALFSRTIRHEQTELDLEILNSSPALDLRDAIVAIDGIPNDAGLNVGQRVGENQWLVAVDELDQVRLLSIDERPALNLSFRLLSATETKPLTETNITFGTDDDDTLSPTAGVGAIFGSEGFDRLVLDSDVDDYLIEQISESQYKLTHISDEVAFIFASLEQFQVDGQLMTLDEFLDATDGSNDSTDFNIVVPIAPVSILNAPPIEAESGQSTQGGRRFEPPKYATVEIEDQNGMARQESDRLTSADSNKEAANPESKKEASESKSRNSETVAVAVENKKANTKISDVEQAPPSVEQIPTRPDSMPKSTPTANPLVDLQDTRSGLELPITRNDPAAALSTRSHDITAAAVLAQNVRPAFDDQVLFAAMDQIEQELVDDSMTSEILVGTGVVVATGYSLAQIAWLLRSSVVLTKLMSSLPIWVSFDPLPLLSHGSDVKLKTNPSESLLDIVNSKS